MTNPAEGGHRTPDDAGGESRDAGSGGGHGGPDQSAAVIIAVDGPAGSGKSSAARGAAVALGLRYLDTGAMYRALTWWLLARGVDVADPAAVARLASRPVIELSTDPATPTVRVDGADVTAQIRTRRVSNAVSAVASVPQVRSHLIAGQQAIIAAATACGIGIVAEGRDIGRVVAPQAPVKVYLTASAEVRARRRSAELAADPAAMAEQTLREQATRDQRDAPQTERAADAVQIESSDLLLDEVVARIVGLAAERTGAAWKT